MVIQQELIGSTLQSDLISSVVLQVGTVILVRVTVDLEIFAGEDGDSIIGEGKVETLGVLGLALVASHQLPLLGEDGEVEVVVVVSHHHLAPLVDGHGDGVVGQTLPADRAQQPAGIVEDLNVVGPVVADEDFSLSVDGHAVGKLQVLRASELGQDIASHVEDGHQHDLAFNDDDVVILVDGHATRVLKDVFAEGIKVVAQQGVGLHAVRRGALGDHHFTSLLGDSDAVGVGQLRVDGGAKLRLETSKHIKDLDTVVVGVGHDQPISAINRDTARFSELPDGIAVLAKLSHVLHPCTLDGWV